MSDRLHGPVGKSICSFNDSGGGFGGGLNNNGCGGSRLNNNRGSGRSLNQKNGSGGIYERYYYNVRTSQELPAG